MRIDQYNHYDNNKKLNWFFNKVVQHVVSFNQSIIDSILSSHALILLWYIFMIYLKILQTWKSIFVFSIIYKSIVQLQYEIWYSTDCEREKQ